MIVIYDLVLWNRSVRFCGPQLLLATRSEIIPCSELLPL
jgi:hypothetical protein